MPAINQYKKGERTTQEYRQLDFSSNSINRAVNKSAAQKPQVLYPLALGILASIAAVVFGPSSWILALAGAGILGGSGAWVYNSILRRDSFVSNYLKQLRQDLEGQVKFSIQRLEQALQNNNMDTALDQLERLKNKFSIFGKMLKSRFNENEITYERYLGMTEQVFMAGLDNLQKSADIATGLSAINREHLQKRLTELKSLDQPDAANRMELEALQSRQQLLQTQQQKIQQYLIQNEQAMTQIDTLMAAIASLENSTSRRAGMEMEDAMQELSRLAERADDYQKNL